ncbi:N-acetylmuramoyl-L-alanine amidase [Streptomyces sp. SP18CS02]|uniref:N-acetylmuramoyl-L-alanine amidase n=1 Tax=Streptomyces sp. SP18CS02 TaxID=3002531 RepID=UPI002E768345|nr:peptidoglycan recognition family protein [Streptomyces sp. SP18CS02]MEE1754709.1 peptidoglycan recognition family protein [Streptomyces sp. SP18CS02]
MERALPSRRGLLRGAALTAATAGLGALTTRTASAASYPTTHWIPASPSNYTVSTRPAGYPVEYVVIHITQETFQDAMRIFKDPARKVSAHYMVASGDGYIGQFVREKDIAWHAGNWSYNTRSIGIEHEGWVDRPEWFTDVMYLRSAMLTAAICDRYAIPRTRARIIGHDEVPGATHTDPGPLWDWTRYMRLVSGF